MRVKEGERLKRVNEEEPYCYEFMGFSNGCREERKATLKNHETGLVFVVNEKDFNKWYEPEELKTLVKYQVYKGELIRGVEDGKTYRCVEEEWYDPWVLEHWEFENVETGEKLVISAGDKSGVRDKYFAVAAPGTFKESRVYENVWQLCVHFDPFFDARVEMAKPVFEDWVEQLKVLTGSFTCDGLVETERGLVNKVRGLVRHVGVRLKRDLDERDCDNSRRGGVPKFAVDENWQYVQRWYYHMSLFYLV